MTNTNSPSLKAEIVSAPAISNMTVTPVGKSMSVSTSMWFWSSVSPV